MDNSIATNIDIAKILRNEMIKKKGKDIVNTIIGKDGIINPNFSKEIWIGNYCITINIH